MLGTSQTRELYGQQIRTAKIGLDEEDVSSFIGNLIKQNDELTDRIENLGSLMQFAQKMVEDAETVAQSMREDAVKAGTAKAEAITREVEETAAAQTARIIADATDQAQDETLRLREEATQLRIACAKSVEEDTRNRFEALCTEFLSGSDVRVVPALPATRCDESAEQAIPEPGLEGTTASTFKVDADLSPRLDEEAEVDQILDAIVEDALNKEDDHSATHEMRLITSSAEETVEAAGEDGSEPVPDDPPAPGAVLEQSNGQDEEAFYEGDVRLKIPPPVSLHGLMTLHRQLKENPDVQVREVTGSAEEGARVDLHLPERVPLLQLLRSLQGVERVSEAQHRDSEGNLDECVEEDTTNTIQLTVS